MSYFILSMPINRFTIHIDIAARITHTPGQTVLNGFEIRMNFKVGRFKQTEI